MTIDLDNLPGPIKFAYLAMTRSAIYFKQSGKDKKFFLSFCTEIWNSMEMSDLNYLQDVISEKMEKDIHKHVNTYVKSKKDKKDNLS